MPRPASPPRSPHREHLPALLVGGLFALLFVLVFVPDHLLFRTYALDLGLYTHAAYQYAHGHWADSLLFLGSPRPLLADHFDLLLLLWSPLTLLFGTWTLLLVQWVAVLCGGLGMYRWLRAYGTPPPLATVGLAFFLAFFGVYGAFTFDFHSNVVAAMAFPWYGLAVYRRRWRAAWPLLVFMLAAKENMGIWLGFAALGFLLQARREPAVRRVLAAQGAVAFAWSALVIGVVMPALADGAPYAGWRYPALGGGPWDALQLLVTAPLHVARALFDGGAVPNGRAIKVEMLVLLFLAGGWALLLRPWLLLMAVPLLLQKLLHGGPAQWGVQDHYAVEFAPLCTFAVFTWRPLLRPGPHARWIAALALGLCLAVTVHILDASIYKGDRSRQRIYQAAHYGRDYDVRAVHALLDGIPPQAAVSASSPFVPQLALRDQLYQFPIVRNAEVIVLATRESPYPLSAEEFQAAMDSLSRSRWWQLTDSAPGALRYDRR